MIRKFKRYWWIVLAGVTAIAVYFIARKKSSLNIGVAAVPPPLNRSKPDAIDPQKLLLPSHSSNPNNTYETGDVPWTLPWYSRGYDSDYGIGPPEPPIGDGIDTRSLDWKVLLGNSRSTASNGSTGTW